MDFIGPFPSSFGNLYILVVVDYVSKWVEAIVVLKDDAKTVLKFFTSIYLPALAHQRHWLVIRVHTFIATKWRPH